VKVAVAPESVPRLGARAALEIPLMAVEVHNWHTPEWAHSPMLHRDRPVPNESTVRSSVTPSGAGLIAAGSLVWSNLVLVLKTTPLAEDRRDWAFAAVAGAPVQSCVETITAGSNEVV